MEAKDTVVKAEDVQDLWIPCETCHREPFWTTGEGTTECMDCMALKHREYQAELSYKAGVKQAVKVYDPYVKALVDENGGLVGLAYSHGWRSSGVEFGKKCRKKIKTLKEMLKPN